MSVKVSQYGVDLYKVTINDGGVIEFNVPNGSLKVNGDLDVTGNSTSVSSQDLIVTDNIIVLNDGEVGPGVSLGTSGIQISRGTPETDARIFWDETLSFLNPDTGLDQPGAFSFQLGSGDLVGIYTNSIQTVDNGNLYLINQGTGVVSVTGTTDYEKNIWSYSTNNTNIDYSAVTSDRLATPVDDDILINVKALKDYVRDYHLYNYQAKISTPAPEGTTEIRLFDVAAGDPYTKAEVGINGVLVATFEETASYLNDLKFQGSSISGTDPATSLTLSSEEGTIVFEDTVIIPDVPTPNTPTSGVALYAGPEADGGTGLYFSNSVGTNSELISKDKALLYSILF